MFKIEYDIELGEEGRPYVYLPEDYEHQPEDRFFALEISIYILQDVLNRRRDELDDNTNKQLKNAIAVLGQISDEMAAILFGEMRKMGEVQILLNPKYHIQVKTIEERDNLPQTNILFNNKIFDRHNGLKVLVTGEMKIYELVDDITNENWKLIE